MHMSQLTELYTLNVQLFVYQLYFNKADSLKKKLLVLSFPTLSIFHSAKYQGLKGALPTEAQAWR